MTRRFAISILFLIHGLIEATWVSRIPEIQARLYADTGALGIALLGSALGAIISMPLTGWLLARGNSRLVTTAAVLAHCAALPLLSLAPSIPLLLGALAIYGAMGGAADICINAEGSALDQESARPMMSSFHALFSTGGMVGAGIGALVVKAGIRVPVHFAAAAVVFAVVSLIAAPLLTAEVPQQTGASAFALPPRSLLGLGALAFCILFGERAMADWTGIYLVRRGSSESFAAYGYAAFSAAMTLGRFCGDALIHRFGPVRVVRTGSAIAAIGLAVSLGIGTPAAGLFGFAAVGLGFSVVVPILFRAGGQTPGIAPGLGIAAVTTLGYLGFLTGPPIVGFAARAAGLRLALGLVALFSIAVCVGARRALRSVA